MVVMAITLFGTYVGPNIQLFQTTDHKKSSSSENERSFVDQIQGLQSMNKPLGGFIIFRNSLREDISGKMAFDVEISGNSDKTVNHKDYLRKIRRLQISKLDLNDENDINNNNNKENILNTRFNFSNEFSNTDQNEFDQNIDSENEK
ncbi:hypothetical protein M0812_13236 [Anaeramoeba flamelloides]|uniref:Uncharacterized protein n=1 Tax=Anaeramoeba flamelloides TaxID=1746091 RepID=A0AAV7ZIZ7_9EUKA|nr:hypothetical protein M0812_13236 [Anaeramoeba flamelloides]